MTWKSTVHDAAWFFEIPERTLRRWIAEGRLRSWTAGRTEGPLAGRRQVRNSWRVVDLEEVEQLRDTRGQGGRLPRKP